MPRNAVFARHLASLLIAVAVVHMAAQDSSADEFRALQGTWIVTAGEQGGKP